MKAPTLDLAAIRSRFPALLRTHHGKPVIHLDGPAGSQVPDSVVEAVSAYLVGHNANTHGAFEPSRETDVMLVGARAAVADLLGADDAECVIFGANMTTLTLALSRSLARTWAPGDEVVVTRLDHDANVTPWVLAARDASAEVRFVPFSPDDTTLDLDALAAALGPRTRLVAVGAASNATGTYNPIERIAAVVRERSEALLFVDAVHHAPHAAIDVDRWDCDFLTCSAYKFYGPHVGILWGRRELLASLPAYQVRPAADGLTDRWSTGTGNHEGIAGVRAAIDYLADLGGRIGPRRLRLETAFEAIADHETSLCERLLDGLADLANVRVWGIRDPARLAERAPTLAITVEGRPSGEIAARLGERGIYVWAGHFYAVEVTAALGLEPDGLVRIGLLHYNTAEEIDRLLEALAEL